MPPWEGREGAVLLAIGHEVVKLYAHMEVVVKIFRVDSKMLTSKFWFSCGLISQILCSKAPGGL